MIATKPWRCDCGCDGIIKPGEEFNIVKGTFYKKGHEKKQIKNAKSK
jgi:hypothetical protein